MAATRLYWVKMLRFVTGILLAAGALLAQRDVVVIDTDSGLFGDDGAAVVMLLRSPEKASVPGLVVTPGNVWTPQGAEYMFHILDLLNQPGLPVYYGAETPLLHTAAMSREAGRRWGALEYAGAFALNPAEVKPAPGAKLTGRQPRAGAVEFLIAEIERQPGQVTILEIAPMTNLALALRLKPSIETKIKRVVFMGGALGIRGNASSTAEFNFWFDPEAARIVLRSRIPEKIMFSLDICNTAPIRKAEFDQIAAAGTPIANLFREDLGNRYPGFLKNPKGTAYMWDSLAAGYLLDPAIVTRSEARYLDVETAWGKSYGATIPLDRSAAPDATPIQVMLKLDYPRAFALYRDLLTQGGARGGPVIGIMTRPLPG
jgi:inosine-uridine nucleoside N-ribohydrolase